MQGLRAASFDSPTLIVLFVLADSDGNYSLYQQVWRKVAGLPFFFPHIRNYAIEGDSSLSELFPPDNVNAKMEYCAHAKEPPQDYSVLGQSGLRQSHRWNIMCLSLILLLFRCFE